MQHPYILLVLYVAEYSVDIILRTFLPTDRREILHECATGSGVLHLLIQFVLSCTNLPSLDHLEHLDSRINLL